MEACQGLLSEIADLNQFSNRVDDLNSMKKYTVLFAFFAPLALLAGCESKGGTVTSDYKSSVGAYGGRRAMSHAGTDFQAKHGAPVLAAAGGYVNRVISSSGGCGKGVVIYHPAFHSYTAYCHLSEVAVEPTGERIERGSVIGFVGATGNAGNVPHVHFELNWDWKTHADGDLELTRDPREFWAGCFDPQATYPRDELILTEPVACE